MNKIRVIFYPKSINNHHISLEVFKIKHISEIPLTFYVYQINGIMFDKRRHATY